MSELEENHHEEEHHEEDISPEQIHRFAAISTVVNLYFIITTLIYLWKRRNPIIQKRQPYLTTVSVACCIIVYNLFSDFEGVFHASLLCIPLLLFAYIAQPLFLFSYFIRMFHLVLSHYMNQAGLTKDEKTVEKGMTMLQRALIRAGKYLVKSDKQKTLTGTEDRIPAMSSGIKTISLLKLIVVYLIVEIVVFILVLFSTQGGELKNPGITVEGCEKSPQLYYGLAVYAFAMLLCVPWAFSVLKNVKDPYYIKIETSLGLIISAFFFFAFSVIGVFIQDKGFRRAHDVFPAAAMIICHTVSVTFPALLALSKEYTLKSLIQNLNRSTFDKILNDSVLFLEFKEQLASDLCIENGIFHEHYREIQEGLRKIGYGKVEVTARPTFPIANPPTYPSDLHDRIKRLYSLFILSGSPFEVNIPGTTRGYAKRSIGEIGTITPEILELIRQGVYENMFLNSFPKFAKNNVPRV